MFILKTDTFKVKHPGTREKHYSPTVLFPPAIGPRRWRSLRKKFKTATAAGEYSRAVADRYNRVFGG